MTDSSRYPIEVFYSEADEGFIAVAKDLPGCSTFGTTQAGAVAEIHDAIEVWQRAARAAGNPIPEPSRHIDPELPSGKILLRIPRSLHASLIECAKTESVSLNQHLVCVLSLSVGTSLLREAQDMVASMQNFVPSVTIGGAFKTVSLSDFSGASWHILDPGTLVRPAAPLDVRALPAGQPVVIGVR